MQVNIKYVNPPGPQSSGKFGSIIDHNGTKIFVPVNMLGQFQAGTTVEVATKEQVWGSTPVIVLQGGPTGAVQGQGYGQGYQAANQAGAPQRANTGFQPKVITGGGSSSTPDQARHIFVTGLVGRAMGSGKFAASEIAVLTVEANRAYDLIGKPARRLPDALVGDPMMDPIPEPEPGDPGPVELQ